MFGLLNTTVVRCCLAKMPFYAVRVGRKPGVYNTWEECEALVKGFTSSRYKKFAAEAEAWAFVNEGSGSNAATSTQSSGPSEISTTTRAKVNKRRLDAGITDSAAVVKRKYKKPTNDVTPEAATDAGEQDYVIVYTDGSCINNGKKTPNAGIGVFWGKNNAWNVSERLKGRQTNNRAEIYAAIKAVRQAKERGIRHLDIHTDSNFLIKSITTWIKGWKKKGWKTAAGTNVLNKADFEELDEELTGINVKWTHVRGHQGIEGNEMADKLANKGAVKPYIFPKDDDWF